ncbi:uncharacterized protein LOC127285383 [Leptopilina boulardi]|uniref:uncharacterized protein LOC127285383 n=1 Tax=Leptopilina boulardi TaxID=63433 RepID=UPI0021F693A2|nr:uncharacterized protein LOC127285383 [Leptopilina boulardi]
MADDTKTYAIVGFADGLVIIPTCWTVYEGNKITQSFYPFNCAQGKVIKLLLSKTPLKDDNARQLLPVQKLHSYAERPYSEQEQLATLPQSALLQNEAMCDAISSDLPMICSMAERFTSSSHPLNVNENIHQEASGLLIPFSNIENEENDISSDEDANMEHSDNYSANCSESELNNCESEDDVLDIEKSDDKLSEDSYVSDSENTDQVSTEEETDENTDDSFDDSSSASKSFQDQIRSWALRCKNSNGNSKIC